MMDAKALTIHLYAETPACLSSARATGNVEVSLDYIPGTALRGTLAAAWLKSHKPNDEFRRYFVNDAVIFGNLYCRDARPLPMTAYSCKDYPGFTAERGACHGVRDMLVPYALHKGIITGPEQTDRFQCEKLEHGSVCGADLTKIRGHYKGFRRDNFSRVIVRRCLMHHTAIASDSETAENAMFYSQELIEADQQFVGRIYFTDPAADSAAFHDALTKTDYVFIGADSKRGLGKFHLDLETADEPIDMVTDALRSRLKRFNASLGIPDHIRYFTVTLLSDAIVTDTYMRFKSTIDACDLTLSDSVVELILAVSDTHIISGWNALARLPKDDVLGISKGSVFLFEIVDGHCRIDDIITSLRQMEVAGVGKRRGEGFGRIVVCDPFHLNGSASW